MATWEEEPIMRSSGTAPIPGQVLGDPDEMFRFKYRTKGIHN